METRDNSQSQTSKSRVRFMVVAVMVLALGVGVALALAVVEPRTASSQVIRAAGNLDSSVIQAIGPTPPSILSKRLTGARGPLLTAWPLTSRASIFLREALESRPLFSSLLAS